MEGLNKSGKLDMVDGLGYMAVLANSSSSLSGPVVKSVPTINGIRTPVRTINSSIPNVSSAFKPIREDSPLESSCLTDGDRSEASGPVSSTPKAKSRRKTSSVETVSYNHYISFTRSTLTLIVLLNMYKYFGFRALEAHDIIFERVNLLLSPLSKNCKVLILVLLLTCMPNVMYLYIWP